MDDRLYFEGVALNWKRETFVGTIFLELYEVLALNKRNGGQEALSFCYKMQYFSQFCFLARSREFFLNSLLFAPRGR